MIIGWYYAGLILYTPLPQIFDLRPPLGPTRASLSFPLVVWWRRGLEDRSQHRVTFALLGIWAGNCCLRHPFSPVLKPRQGGGMLFYCWTGLTWPQDIMPASMPALQQRLEAPSRCGDMCRGPSSGPSGRWFHPSLAGIFPAQLGPQIVSVLFFRE